jgi:hypothetical protein
VIISRFDEVISIQDFLAFGQLAAGSGAKIDDDFSNFFLKLFLSGAWALVD